MTSSTISTSTDEIRDIVQNSVLSQQEIENGWVFTLNDTLSVEILEQFVSTEQKCCLFLDFQIDTSSDLYQCKVIQDPSFSHDIETVKEIILALFD